MAGNLDLMFIHIEALFTLDEDMRLLSVNEPHGAAAPRFFLGRTLQGNVGRFRADLSHVLVGELNKLVASEPIISDCRAEPANFASYIALLNSYQPVEAIWMGPAFAFAEYFEPDRPVVSITPKNAELLRGGFEELLEEVSDQRPFFAIVVDGRAVSVCRSVRITAEAHEAGLETLPEFRGRGYAKNVVAAWARLIQSMGAIPLYCTSWNNSASQSVARKLKLTMYGIDFHIT
jgi:hypothetical protein